MSAGGKLSYELQIDFGTGIRSPEEVRGTSQFAQYYNSIWSQLRSAIEE